LELGGRPLFDSFRLDETALVVRTEEMFEPTWFAKRTTIQLANTPRALGVRLNRIQEPAD
jgi:hypothetical protein